MLDKMFMNNRYNFRKTEDLDHVCYTLMYLKLDDLSHPNHTHVIE